MSDETNDFTDTADTAGVPWPVAAEQPAVDATMDAPAQPVADDQGNTEPVVPTDTPVVQDAVIDVTDEALAAALARVAELEAEVDELRGSGSPAKRAQRSNSRSARVARYEESAFQGAVAGWERDTGQVYDDFADPTTDPVGAHEDTV